MVGMRSNNLRNISFSFRLLTPDFAEICIGSQSGGRTREDKNGIIESSTGIST